MSQILNGRGVRAAFDADGVHLDRSAQRVDIPLAAVREVRAAQARAVDIVLTDGVIHRVEGGNPTATAAFAAALTAALPEQRDPAGSALVTSSAERRAGFGDWWPLAAAALVVAGYLAYAVWVAATHGARVLGVVVGLLPLGLGLFGLGTTVQETFRRILLSRRGITVLAHAVGTTGKRSVVFEYTDTEGRTHTYACRRRMPATQLSYDPLKPGRAVHALSLPLAVAKAVVLFVGCAVWLVVGVVMVFGPLW
ncbi:hypothetical protein [Streptomyces sp. NPDC003832]